MKDVILNTSELVLTKQGYIESVFVYVRWWRNGTHDVLPAELATRMRTYWVMHPVQVDSTV
jgi:hypothetical protein